MAELRIRIGRAEDVDDMERLEQICFSAPWSRESLLFELTENPRAVYVVAEYEGHVIGYVGVWTLIDEGHITNVAVSPEFRRKKVGSALIASMLDITQQAGILHHTLEVRAGNEPAKGLYKHFGFEESGVRRGYYEDNGEDAIIMWRHAEV